MAGGDVRRLVVSSLFRSIFRGPRQSGRSRSFWLLVKRTAPLEYHTKGKKGKERKERKGKEREKGN